jgi:hypothetical protein
MNKDKIIKIVKFYREHLTDHVQIQVEVPPRGLDFFFGNKPTVTQRPLGEPQRWVYNLDEDDRIVAPGRESQLRHALWMTNAILESLESGDMSESDGKVFRWLGFLQGVLWSQAIFSLEELKKHNRNNVRTGSPL